MAKLTKSQKKFIRDNYEKISTEEIAETLDLKPGNVKDYIQEIQSSQANKEGSINEIEELENEFNPDKLSPFVRLFNTKSFVIILLVIFSLAAYSNSFKAQYLENDRIFLDSNVVSVKDSMKNIYNLEKSFNGSLMYLSLSIDSKMAGDSKNPEYKRNLEYNTHFTNIVIHIINGLLVYFLALNIFGLFSEKAKGSFRIRYIFAPGIALMFLVHPMTTEAINFVSYRGVLLAAMFSLTCINLYIVGRTNSKYDSLCLSFAIISFVFGLLSHPIIFLAPVLIAIIEFLFIKKYNTINAVIYSLSTWLVSLVGYGIVNPNSFDSIRNLSMSGKAFIFVYNIFYQAKLLFFHYLPTLLFPLGNSLVYDLSVPITPDQATFSLFMLVFAAACIFFAVKYRKAYPVITIGTLWFVICGITCGVAVVDEVGVDRTAYFPMIGFCFMFVWLIAHLVSKWEKKSFKTWYGLLGVITVLFVVTIFAGLSARRNSMWKDPARIWRNSYYNTSENTIARSKAAFYYGLNIAKKHNKKDDEYKANVQAALELFKEVTEDVYNKTYYYAWGNLYKARHEVLLADLAKAKKEEQEKIDELYNKAIESYFNVYNDEYKRNESDIVKMYLPAISEGVKLLIELGKNDKAKEIMTYKIPSSKDFPEMATAPVWPEIASLKVKLGLDTMENQAIKLATSSIQSLKKLAKENPNDVKQQISLAEAYISDWENPKSLESLNKLIEQIKNKFPDSIDVKKINSKYFALNRKYRPAFDIYENIIKTEYNKEKKANLYYELAEIFKKKVMAKERKNRDEMNSLRFMQEAIEKAIEYDPNNYLYHKELARIHNHVTKRNYIASLAELQRCLEIRKKKPGLPDPDLYLLLAEAYDGTNKKDKALEYFDETWKAYEELGGYNSGFTQYSLAYIYSGNIARMHGDKEAARERYEKFLRNGLLDKERIKYVRNHLIKLDAVASQVDKLINERRKLYSLEPIDWKKEDTNENNQ